MHTRLTYFFPLLAFLLSTCVSAQIYPITLDLASANQLSVTESPAGTYTINTMGGDPNIGSEALLQTYDPESVYVISFEYDASNGLDNFQIFYGAPFSAARRVDFGSLPKSTGFRTFKAFMKIEAPEWTEDYQQFRFDWGLTGMQEIVVRNLQLRAPTSREVIPFSLNPTMRNQAPTVDNGDGSFDITTVGPDPWVRSTLIQEMYNPDSVYVLSFDYTTMSGLNNNFQIFYGQPDNPARRALYPAIAPTGPQDTMTFTTVLKADVPNWDQFYDRFRFDWGTMAGLDVQVSNFLLREPTNAEMKLIAPPSDTVAIELNVNSTSGGLTATETAPLTYDFTTMGNDPWIGSKIITEAYDINESYIIEFEYQATEEFNLLEIFYGPPNGARILNAGPLPAASEWTTMIINPLLLVDNFQNQSWNRYRFDFGKGEGVDNMNSGKIRNIILRKPTAQELIDQENSDKFVSRRINEDFLTYFTEAYPGSIDSVGVGEATVSVSGQLPPDVAARGAAPGDYFLAEVQPQEYGFNLENYVFTEAISPQPDGSFQLDVDRFPPRNGGLADRIYSRWVIVQEDVDGNLVKQCPLAWPTDLCFRPTANLEEQKAATVKGLDGLTPSTLSNFDDLTDLGISSMKINLLLNGVFSPNPNAPTTHTFNGKTYGINQTFVDNIDSRIIACTNAGIKTSFVLLIPINFTNPALQDIFVHPDAVNSVSPYTMANVTSAEGVEHYTALVDFLSERYSRADSLYGRMDSWIIHNEVDAHTNWTYAGQKPVELYTQIYDRSMRLVHYTIRKHNPTAKVLGSFTKHWNSKAGSSANFRSVDILDQLSGLSKLEGDYEWGIGWHSYPTNLFNPLVWNDPPAQTRLDFLTPQITPRNIEVIDAYVRQRDLLYNGKKVRTILLSENGFNSNSATNPNANETTQAAALAYFWKKVNGRTPAIENIQLHRWVDNAGEAGILFGLWTVQDGTFDGFDQKKEGWDVWNAAGTPSEDAVFMPYLSTVGVSDWSDTYFDFPSETTPWPVTMTLDCFDETTNTMVTFNGEKKFPQPDGTLRFFNVASDVTQDYQVYVDGQLVEGGALQVTGDTTLKLSLCALPVTFTYFEAEAVGKSAALNWSNSPEPDNAGYRVERSADARNWNAIANVAAKPVTVAQDYRLLDENPLPGANYYRIVQHDFDGQETTSPVRLVRFGAPRSLLVAPNPTAGKLHFSLPDDRELDRLELIDQTGRALRLSVRDYTADLSDQPAGIYLLRAIDREGAVLTARVVLR